LKSKKRLIAVGFFALLVLMNEPEYKTRFLQHMGSLQVDAAIALSEYDAHVESNPNVWEEDPATPEADADECMTYWD
jgi:hypothetical protein